MPQAIEFAAARIGAFGIRNLASHLDDRSQFLKVSRFTSSPRHQTIGTSLDWSYQILGEDEQILFRRLAVFRGSFTLDAAFEALGMVEEFECKESHTNFWCQPEFLRQKGEALMVQGVPDPVAAESYFLRALGIACASGGLGWELRSAVSLGRLYQKNGRRPEACPPWNPLTAGLRKVLKPAISATRLLDEFTQGDDRQNMRGRRYSPNRRHLLSNCFL